MNSRIPIALTLGLILLAFGGFYFALSPRSSDLGSPLPPTASAPIPVAPERPAPQPSKPVPPPPAMATPASVEAEIANTDNAELQTLLKTNFSSEYGDLISFAVRRRNEGVTGERFGQELSDRLQDMMRPKLKFAVGASMPTIDKLAANESSLFHALATDGAGFCLKLLGKEDTPSAAQPPANVREMMRLGTLYRFQAIVEGMPDVKPVAALTADDIKAFEASLASDGLKFDEVRSGAFMAKEGNEAGKPCLMLEKLYQVIARLPEGTRRKIYAGMFFLDRDK
jgi:hypothetical protein